MSLMLSLCTPIERYWSVSEEEKEKCNRLLTTMSSVLFLYYRSLDPRMACPISKLAILYQVSYAFHLTGDLLGQLAPGRFRSLCFLTRILHSILSSVAGYT
jgi:hypothetical protein